MHVEKRKTHLIVKMAAAYSSFKLFNLVISLVVILVLNATDGETVEANLCHKSCETEKFDEVMKILMSYGKIPGAQLAVAKGGEVKYFKAFGVANRETGELVSTHHVMRFNSISKFITGVVILKLIQVSQNDL
jgi:CubicO group peptidase (beta-lactamase class C family)